MCLIFFFHPRLVGVYNVEQLPVVEKYVHVCMYVCLFIFPYITAAQQGLTWYWLMEWMSEWIIGLANEWMAEPIWYQRFYTQ